MSTILLTPILYKYMCRLTSVTVRLPGHEKIIKKRHLI